MPRFTLSLIASAIVSVAAMCVETSAAEKAKATPYPLILGPIRLWEGDAPGALGQRPQDIPTLTPYAPDAAKKNGATILILPGGGYGNLAEHEGTGYAEWFAARGITAYVLKYRLGSNGYRHPIELGDAARALRMVRAFAKRDGLDPARLDARDALRCRQGRCQRSHRARKLAARLGDPMLPGDFVRRVCARRLAEKPARRKSSGRSRPESLERTPSDEGHAAVLPLAHSRGQGGAG
jgi:hypothetical protein